MTELIDARLSATDYFTPTMNKMIKSLGKMGVAQMGVAAAAVVASTAVAKSISIYADFEQQLAKVNTMLSRGESKFLPGYASAMKQLAGASGQATETLSDGLYDILSASRGAEDAISILSATTKAAVAGFTDVSVATAAALTTLNAFKLANSQIDTVLDKQFATVKRGRLTYEQYANTIGTLAATSSLAGQSIESMNAAVATVTRGGISAERAIVAINGAMLAYLKPTKVAIAAAKQHGIELNVNAIQGDNLALTLKKLKTLRAEELAQIFVERRAFKAMAVLTKDYAGFVRDLGEQHNSAGAMIEANSKASNTLNIQWERTKRIAENAGLAIGKFFTPALREALKAFNDFTNKTDPETWLEKQKEALKEHQKLLEKTFAPAEKAQLQVELGISEKELEHILDLRKKILDTNIQDEIVNEFRKKVWEEVQKEIIQTELDIRQVGRSIESMKSKADFNLLAIIFGDEEGVFPGQLGQMEKLETKLSDLKASAFNLLGKINKDEAIAKFLRQAAPLTEAVTQSNIETEKSLEKQVEHQEKMLKLALTQGPAMQQGLADAIAKTNIMREEGVVKTTRMLRAEESLKTQVEEGSKSEKTRLDIMDERLKKAREILAIQGRELRAKGPRDTSRDLLEGQFAPGAPSAPMALFPTEDVEREDSLRRQLEVAQMAGEAKLRAAEAERLADEELHDGKLTREQSYWESVSELMRATYDAQGTLSNIAATQSVAFIERSFSALESEFMKSKVTSKSVLKALETEAKRGAIRTSLEFVKNELKGLFIVDKVKKDNLVKDKALTKALRTETYLNQMVKTASNAYGNTFASIAAIPVIGPALAPAAAATAKATVLAAMAPAAAHGGIDYVPGYSDNQTFLLKEGERVLQPDANVKLTNFLNRVESGTLEDGSGGAQSIMVKIQMGATEFKDFVYETVTTGTRDGDIIVDQRSVAV